MPQFGEMLRELREERRLTQIELANAMHISSSSISAYEIGSSLPPMERALEFADFFEVSLDYLFGRSGVRYDLSILNRPIHRNKTIGDLVMLVNAMPENKQSLLYKMALSLERIPDTELKYLNIVSDLQQAEAKNFASACCIFRG